MIWTLFKWLLGLVGLFALVVGLFVWGSLSAYRANPHANLEKQCQRAAMAASCALEPDRAACAASAFNSCWERGQERYRIEQEKRLLADAMSECFVVAERAPCIGDPKSCRVAPLHACLAERGIHAGKPN